MVTIQLESIIDQSVLENHHAASSFAVLAEEDFNIFQNFTKEDYKKARQKMVGAILTTDMSKHFGELGRLKNRISASDFKPAEADKDEFMFFMFHLADISNQGKLWDVCFPWTCLLFEEFFHQGDIERDLGMPISMLMDRCTVNVAKSQIGFIDFIIMPSFTAVSQVLPALEDTIIKNVEQNKALWPSKNEFFENRMAEDKRLVEQGRKPASRKVSLIHMSE